MYHTRIYKSMGFDDEDLQRPIIANAFSEIVPGMLMGCIRASIPSIMAPGGPMLSGPAFGHKAKADGTAVTEVMGMCQAGKISWQDVMNLTRVLFLLRYYQCGAAFLCHCP